MRAAVPWIRGTILAGAVAVVCAVLSACAPPRLAPTPEDAAWAATQWPGTTDADLAEGYAAYRKRCSGCHHLPLPDAHTPEKWARTVPVMAGKAKLTAGQQDAVLRYILAVRTRTKSTTALDSTGVRAGPAPGPTYRAEGLWPDPVIAGHADRDVRRAPIS